MAVFEHIARRQAEEALTAYEGHMRGGLNADRARNAMGVQLCKAARSHVLVFLTKFQTESHIPHTQLTILLPPQIDGGLGGGGPRGRRGGSGCGAPGATLPPQQLRPQGRLRFRGLPRAFLKHEASQLSTAMSGRLRESAAAGVGAGRPGAVAVGSPSQRRRRRRRLGIPGSASSQVRHLYLLTSSCLTWQLEELG